MDRDRFINALASGEFKTDHDRARNAYREPPQMNRDEKLAAAVKYLGTRYLLHPDNRVRKIDAPRKPRHS